MNHPHIQLLRDHGHCAVSDCLEFNGDRMAVHASEWMDAFRFLSSLPRGSTLREIVRHALERTAK